MSNAIIQIFHLNTISLINLIFLLRDFTVVEVSIAVKFFTETGLLALSSNPQPGEYPF
jgi:hypothetical protein